MRLASRAGKQDPGLGQGGTQRRAQIGQRTNFPAGFGIRGSARRRMLSETFVDIGEEQIELRLTRPALDAQRPVSRAEAGMPRQLLRDSLGVRARRGDIP